MLSIFHELSILMIHKNFTLMKNNMLASLMIVPHNKYSNEIKKSSEFWQYQYLMNKLSPFSQ